MKDSNRLRFISTTFQANISNEAGVLRPRRSLASVAVRTLLCTIIFFCGHIEFAHGADWTDPDMHKLSSSEKSQLLSSEFEPIKNTGELPKSVAEHYNLLKDKNVMAEPGQNWSAGCTGPADVPRERLIFAGKTKDRCLVFFERGGIAHFFLIQLFDLSGDQAKLLWGAYVRPQIKTIDDLKKALKAGTIE